MRKSLTVAVAVVAGALLAAPTSYASTNKEAFAADVLRAGIPTARVSTFQFWAPMACQLAQKMDTSDEEVIEYMQTDLDDIIAITPDQATLIWASAKRNIC